MSLRILEQDIPGIEARVRGLPPERRRRLAEAAAALALRERPVDDPRVAAATRGKADVDALQGLVDELDDEAAARGRELDDARERGEQDAELAAAHVAAFERARAVAALVAALDLDVDRAVADALYEATGAIGYDTARIDALVDAA
jgi:hypothetical protein